MNYIVFYSGVAQLAAQATVNRRVVGSSPAVGADTREAGPVPTNLPLVSLVSHGSVPLNWVKAPGCKPGT